MLAGSCGDIPRSRWSLELAVRSFGVRDSASASPLGVRRSSVRSGSDDYERVVAHSETIPASCGSSSDVGAHSTV